MFNFEETNKAGKDAMDTMLKSYSAIANGVQTLASEAAGYSKQSFEYNAAVAEKLSGAKSLENVFEIQSDYARTAYENFVQQSTKMGEIYAGLARDAYKPFEQKAAKAAA